MKVHRLTIAPSHPVFFIDDGAYFGEITELDPKLLVNVTPRVLSVSCAPDVDGDTTILVGPASAVAPAEPPAFDGTIDVPKRRVMLTSAIGDLFLELPIGSARARIRIWANRSLIPDELVIAVDEIG